MRAELPWRQSSTDTWGGPPPRRCDSPVPMATQQRYVPTLADAGFEHIETTVSVAHLRSASGADLFEQAVLLTSLAPALTALDADQRLALTAEFDNSPVLRAPSGELAVPIEATVIVAQRTQPSGTGTTRSRSK